MSFLLWRKNHYWAHTSNISTKFCYLIGGLDHRADLLLHLHLRHFGRRIPIFYRDSRENNSMEKYVIYFVIFVTYCYTYVIITFLSHLKKLKSMPRILLEKFKRAFFYSFQNVKKDHNKTLHVKGHEILNFTFWNVKFFWLIFSMNLAILSKKNLHFHM